MPADEKKRNQILNDLLKKNDNKHLNIFGRKQIYLVASFNEWMPIELRTNQEIKQLRIKGQEALMQMDDRHRAKLGKSKKKADNEIKFTHFLPPGKHFFYFIYKNEYVFLSPNYDVVRFKGSNALVNTVIIRPRRDEIELVTLGRNILATEEMKFNKDKSVWKTYLEDEPEHLEKCLNQDLEHGKLFRVAKEEYGALRRAILADYMDLKDIFTCLASMSSYPVISWNDYSLFVNRS